MSKDCVFYQIPEKCKECDYKDKCVALRFLLDIGKILSGNKGIFGLLPKISIGNKKIEV